MLDSTLRRYLNESSLTGKTTISEIIWESKPIVRTTETFFHPQGGGQKADRGNIGPAHVLHVVHNGGLVDHFVDSADGLQVGSKFDFAIDIEWRKLNSAYHTGGHLIASLIEAKNIGLTAIAGHQWPGEARVEFAIAEGFDGQFTPELLSAELRDLCLAKLPIQINGDPFKNREIQIGNFKPIPCGGTHLNNLSELASVKVTGMKAKSGRLRISYEAAPA
jgi:Ser-tRNA(Ala) deacylase AlaX